MGHKGVPISTLAVPIPRTGCLSSQTPAGCFEQVCKQMQKTFKHDILQTVGLNSLMQKTAKHMI